MPLISRAAIRSLIARFAISRKGNVAVIFAIACIPVIAAMGVAVDYTRGSQATTEMQDALDAASLALSRRSDLSTMSSSQIQQFANDYFNANFHNTEVKDLVLNASYTATGPSVTIKASGNLPTDFMGILGKEFMPLGRSSTTVWGEARLRVALALDNTGSMSSSNKMTALKNATHNLLTQLKGAAAVDGDVYVSIVPFVKDVNVKDIAGNPYYNASWIKWDGTSHSDSDLWDNTYGTTHGTCTGTAHWVRQGWSWTYVTPSSYDNKSDCENNGFTWAPDHSKWDGCVMDRDQDYDTLNTAPTTSNTATLFPAQQYYTTDWWGNETDLCPTPIMGLSYNWTALNNKVDAMSANGNTNQAIGLQWAWQSLTASPFTIPPMDPSRVYKQVIILLTDGLNTEDRWYSRASQIDARQEKLCDNIKAAGVTLYTVQVNTTHDPTSTLLQNCASSPDKFFLLTSSDQIVTTFQQIGTELSELRISH